MTAIDVMHSTDRVVLQIDAMGVRTAVVLIPSEAEDLARRIRDQAHHAQNLAPHACDCGHDGLDAMFHLTPCPVALLRRQARKLGYDLALIPREDA